MNQFHSSSEGQSIKKHRYTMGYKSSQTIAAISWKTLHTIIKKNIFSNGEYLQAEPMLSRIHSNDGIDKYSRGNKSVMPNTINSMKY